VPVIWKGWSTVSELLDNTGYIWMFILGGFSMSITEHVYAGVIAVWIFAALAHMYRYDPTAVIDGE